MTIRRAWVLGLVLAAGCSGGLDPAKEAALIRQAERGIVIVEMQLRADKGEFPPGGWSENMPFGVGMGGGSYGEMIGEERPLEGVAFLLSPTLAVMGDPEVASRFVKGVAVRFENETVPAKIAGYALDRRAVFVELEKPLKGPAPFVFDRNASGPYLALSHGRVDGAWASALRPFVQGFLSVAKRGNFLSVSAECLVLNARGGFVGVCADDRVPADDSWKGSPVDWPRLSVEEAAKRMDALDQACAKSVVRVKLSFRSPHKDQARGPRRRFAGEEGEGSTEANVPGLVTAPDRVVVLTGLRPSVTARLERIVVCTDNGEVPAKFLNTLADYQGLVVAPEAPAGVPARMSAENDLGALQGRLIFVAEARIQGENRAVQFTPQRFHRFNIGWRRQVYGYVFGRGYAQFVFDNTGALVAVPLARREKGPHDDYRGQGEPLTAVTYLREVFADPARFADANNVPLSEETENRLAWLGVELQPLNRALARLNKVSDLTADGETGAIVSTVYPDSPAEAGGLKTGDILLRLHIEGYPKPLDVRMEEYDFAERAFPWEQLDLLREQYFDQVPRPWPGVANAVTTALTEAGFAKKFEAEVFRAGKTLMLPFVVTESPTHYDSAGRFKSKPLGMTVRDLTYEVRRYFQKKADEPGVIISNIEAGSKASVSGLKPYEIITAVNETPVKNVKDFEDAVKPGEELRLNVLRMTKTRIVKISLKGGETPKPAKPAVDEPTDDGE